MKNLNNLKVLMVADSSSVMQKKSFKSGLYPEIFKIFHSLFGSAKICFCDELKVFDFRDISYLGNSSTNRKIKLSLAVRILRYLEIFIGRNLYFEKSRYRHLLKNIELEFDLVISITSSFHSGVLGYLISKNLKTSFIILEHKTHYQRNLVRFWHKRLIKYVQQEAAIIAPVSKPLETAIKKFNPKIKTHVVHNPIGNEMFKPSSSRLISKLQDFSNGSYCFGAWTTWRKIKRLDLLLDAFSEIRINSKKSFKLIVGGKTSDAYLISRMNNDPDILFLGALTRDDIRAISGFVDCCVICSDHETFGLPISEAMAQGTPVIATRSGGVEGLIDQTLGIVIEKDNLNYLVDAMKLITKRNYSAKKIKDFAEAKFGTDAIKQIWSNVISSLY